MGETARAPEPTHPGFSAVHDPGNQAATTPPPHGNQSKLQGHARHKGKHGVCAAVDRTAQILALCAFGPRSTRREMTSWPKVRGALPAIAPDLVLSVPTSRAALPNLVRSSAPRAYRASLPVPTTRETNEASRQTVRTVRVHECSSPPLQLPENLSWKPMQDPNRRGC